MIEGFSRYSFNSSHAYSYAYLCYQTAYLKANYPKEFMAALCGSMIDDIDRCSFYLNEAKRMGLKIYGPDINKSSTKFTVEQDGLRIGLAALRNIGEDSAANIISERNNHGDYVGLMDIVFRVEPNSRELTTLAFSGALNGFGSRLGISTAVPEILKSYRKRKKKIESGQIELFDDTVSDLDIPTAEFQLPELLENEFAVTGLYISGHPLDDYSRHVTDWNVSELDQLNEKDRASVLALITSCQIKRTKNGKKMAILTVQDQTASKEVVVFPKQFDANPEIESGLVSVVSLRSGTDFNGEKNYIFDSIIERFEKEEDSSTAELKIYLPQGFSNDEAYISKLKKILSANYGWTPVSLYLSRSTRMKLPRNFTVNFDQDLLEELRNLFKDYASR
jgi:DNA polymerase-3 subunit alpha